MVHNAALQEIADQLVEIERKSFKLIDKIADAQGMLRDLGCEIPDLDYDED